MRLLVSLLEPLCQQYTDVVVAVAVGVCRVATTSTQVGSVDIKCSAVDWVVFIVQLTSLSW